MMCEILIFARNNTHSDADKDRRGCYKRGMAVIVHNDGHTWGREESKQRWITEGFSATSWPGQEKFIILKLPGISAAKANDFIAPQTEDDLGAPALDAKGIPIHYRIRRWYIRLDALPNAVKNTLIADGEYTTEVAAIRNYMIRIRDGAQYTGID